MKIKSILYKIFNKKLTEKIIDIFSPTFLTATNLKKRNGNKKQSFYVVITVDTEPGHIKKDLTRAWLTPSDFQGYYSGIKYLRETASKYGAKLTLLLCTQCFTAQGHELKKTIDQLKRSYKSGHEIGLHLHPRKDLALKNELKEELKKTASKFYSEETITNMLNTQRNLIKTHLGEEIEKDIISFRWGNWALSDNAVNSLEKTNFKIDSSAVPGLKGHSKDSRIYDWTHIKTHNPFFLKHNEQTSNILEIPIATFKFMGKKFRADPFLNSSMLINSLNYYYNNADRSEKPFIFVVITHSSEAIYQTGKKSYVVDNLDKFLKHCSELKDIEFVTLKEAYDKYIN